MGLQWELLVVWDCLAAVRWGGGFVAHGGHMVAHTLWEALSAHAHETAERHMSPTEAGWRWAGERKHKHTRAPGVCSQGDLTHSTCACGAMA